jgi:hypothetical protein
MMLFQSRTASSCARKRRSKLGHGVFTYAPSQRLNGEADRAGIFALSDYVSDEVKRMSLLAASATT